MRSHQSDCRSTSFCTKNSQESVNFTLKKLEVLQNYKVSTHPAYATPIPIQHISCGSLGHWGVLTGQDSYYSTSYNSVSEPDLVSARLLSREEKETKKVREMTCQSLKDIKFLRHRNLLPGSNDICLQCYYITVKIND